MNLDQLFSLLEAPRMIDPHRRFGDSVNPHWEPTDHNDRAHLEAMKKTGFWGEQGAGCIFLARDTGRLLLAPRSPNGGALLNDVDRNDLRQRCVGSVYHRFADRGDVFDSEHWWQWCEVKTRPDTKQ